jgi:hypothetical protein
MAGRTQRSKLLGPFRHKEDDVNPAQHTAADAEIGDVLVITGHRVGEAERAGEILEVLGEPGHRHYQIRWDDGHESVFYPSNDAIVRPARKKKR